MELAYPVLSDGEFPTKENEIAIESLALVKLGIDAKVGDTITLKVNNQNGSETFDTYTEKNYTLVGILKNRRNNLQLEASEQDLIPAAYIAKNTKVDLGGKEALVAYFNLYNNSKSVRLTFDDEILHDASGEYNRNIIWIGDYEILYTNDQSGYQAQETIVFVILLVVVLMLVSCTGIVNSFNSNLKERKKQIGMLRAVGATKRQIIKIFGREAFIISLIAAPISIALSYIVVLGIVKLLGDNFIFVPDFLVLILCGIFSIICVMLASLIPLIAASKITPVQSIRNIEDNRKMKNKKIKSKKAFNVSSLISKRSITFGRGKQAVVSIILVVSIIMSGYALSWYTYSKDNFYNADNDYQLYLSSSTIYSINYKSNNIGFSEQDKQMLQSIPYVKTAVGTKTVAATMVTPYTTSDYRKTVSGHYESFYSMNFHSREEELEASRKVNKDNYEEFLFPEESNNPDTEFQKYLNCNEYINTMLSSADLDYIKALNKYVYDGEINVDKLNSGEEIILLAPKKVGMYLDDITNGTIATVYNDNVDKENCIFTDVCDFHAGDELDISVMLSSQPVEAEDETTSSIPADTENTRKTVKIGAIITDEPYGITDYAFSNFGVITTTAGLNSFISDIKYSHINLTLDRECTKEINDEVTTVIKSITGNIENADFLSNFGYQEQQRIDNRKIFIAMLAIIILFFTICLSMINNSITSNIRNSKQKIGTLRAVGASERDLVLVYIKQMLSMFLWGISIGFVGFFTSYIVVAVIHKAHSTKMEMIFNPLGAIAFCVIVFVACSINLWSKIRKEMKNSIVENIREL